MATLAGQTIADSYEQLLSLPDGGGNGTSLVAITDGDAGTTFAIKVSTDSSSTTTGSIHTDGGVGIAKKLYVGTDLDVNGTTNLDAVDIDGSVQLDGTLTVGTDGSGQDVTFYSATAGDNFTWDSSEEKLIITGTSGAVALDIHTGKATFGDAGTTYATINQNSLMFRAATGEIGTETDHDLRFKTNNTIRTTIDSNGAMTNTSQPAVQAVANATSSNENIATSGTHTIVFDREVFDQGGNFASNTTFTAPVTGKYQLNFTTKLLNIDESATYIAIYITTTNRTYTHQYDNADLFDADSAYHSINLSDLVDLDASDTLIIGIKQSGGAAQMDLEGDSSASVTRLSVHLVC